jgi:alkylhydroperoxidase family enzyme
VLADYRTAPVSPKCRAMLGLVEKLTLTPDAVTAEDVQVVRDAGVSDAAIEDAIHIMGAFSVIVRIADAFRFHVPDTNDFRSMGRDLLKRGYV